MDPESPRLLTAELSDAKAIFELEQEIFAQSAWSLKTIEGELTAQHRDYWVLKNERNTVLGYLGLLVVGGDADIQTIAVAKDLRTAGYGRKLLETALSRAKEKGASRVFLEVRADNLVAQKLYESVGFVTIAVRERYYQPEGVDAHVMCLEITR